MVAADPVLLGRVLDPVLRPEFGTSPLRLEITDTDSLTLAIIGDAGTGGAWADGEGQPSPSDAIFAQAEALGVDYTIPLGDTYFIGRSPFEDEFLKAWKPGRRGSFNLNSNHDMYAWGKG